MKIDINFQQKGNTQKQQNLRNDTACWDLAFSFLTHKSSSDNGMSSLLTVIWQNIYYAGLGIIYYRKKK